MKYTILVMASCVMFLAGCDAPESLQSKSEAAEAKADFEAATSAFHQSLRTNDTEKFLSFLADDVVLMPPDEAPVRGESAVKAWFEGFLSQYRTTSLSLADQEVFLGGRWGVELGTYEWGLAPAAGGATVIDRGNYMQLWRTRADGKWRLIREVYNSSVPATAPATP